MTNVRRRCYEATVALAFSVTMVSLCGGSALRGEESSCCSIVHRAMSATAQIKPGMKRKDVEKAFSEDGGLSFNGEGRYVFKECPLIKIKVKFSGVSGAKGKESPDDIVADVSPPYMEAPMKD
jgi:hypothetical protein